MAESQIERAWRRQWWWFLAANCAAMAFEALVIGGPCGFTILVLIGTSPRLVLSLVGALRRTLSVRRTVGGAQGARRLRGRGWMRESVLAGIAIGGPMLMFGLGSENAQIGSRNSAELVEAIDQYHGATGTYPPNLEALVPHYIDEVPRACLGPLGCRFRYQVDDVADHAQLFWSGRALQYEGNAHYFDGVPETGPE